MSQTSDSDGGGASLDIDKSAQRGLISYNSDEDFDSNDEFTVLDGRTGRRKFHLDGGDMDDTCQWKCARYAKGTVVRYREARLINSRLENSSLGRLKHSDARKIRIGSRAIAHAVKLLALLVVSYAEPTMAFVTEDTGRSSRESAGVLLTYNSDAESRAREYGEDLRATLTRHQEMLTAKVIENLRALWENNKDPIPSHIFFYCKYDNGTKATEIKPVRVIRPGVGYDLSKVIKMIDGHPIPLEIDMVTI